MGIKINENENACQLSICDFFVILPIVVCYWGYWNFQWDWAGGACIMARLLLLSGAFAPLFIVKKTGG